MKQEPEHWTTWLARKTYKSSFGDRNNHSSYSPLTNTVGLLDGSAEAMKILRDAQMVVFDQTPTLRDLHAMGALTNALDYVKGKDLRGRFSHTLALCPDSLVEWAETTETKPKLVHISDIRLSEQTYTPSLEEDESTLCNNLRQANNMPAGPERDAEYVRLGVLNEPTPTA